MDADLSVMGRASGRAGLERRPVTVRVLLVPADEGRHCVVLAVGLTAVALSDAIGGGLLDETLHARVGGGQTLAVYLDEDRVVKGLAGNRRAANLSARLGLAGRDWLRTLTGDALFVGQDRAGQDCDVPAIVLDAARRLDLLACPGRQRNQGGFR